MKQTLPFLGPFLGTFRELALIALRELHEIPGVDCSCFKVVGISPTNLRRPAGLRSIEEGP